MRHLLPYFLVAHLVAATPPACFLGCINRIGHICPLKRNDVQCLCNQKPAVLDCIINLCWGINYYSARDHFMGTCVEHKVTHSDIVGNSGANFQFRRPSDIQDFGALEEEDSEREYEKFEGITSPEEDFIDMAYEDELALQLRSLTSEEQKYINRQGEIDQMEYESRFLAPRKPHYAKPFRHVDVTVKSAEENLLLSKQKGKYPSVPGLGNEIVTHRERTKKFYPELSPGLQVSDRFLERFRAPNS